MLFLFQTAPVKMKVRTIYQFSPFFQVTVHFRKLVFQVQICTLKISVVQLNLFRHPAAVIDLSSCSLVDRLNFELDLFGSVQKDKNPKRPTLQKLAISDETKSFL